MSIIKPPVRTRHVSFRARRSETGFDEEQKQPVAGRDPVSPVGLGKERLGQSSLVRAGAAGLQVVPHCRLGG